MPWHSARLQHALGLGQAQESRQPWASCPQTLLRSQHPLLSLTVCVCVWREEVSNSPHHFLELPVSHECLWPGSVTTFATSQECWGVGCP